MTTLTDWLDQAQARVEAATDGPWSTTFGPRENPRVWGPDDDDAEPIAILRARGFIEPDDAKATAEFMAHARADLPAAIAALRAVLDLVEMDRDDRMAPMRGYTPAVAKSSVRAAIATALGVTP